MENDYVIKDFRFASGEDLPELRIHYRTLGAPHRSAQGIVENAVLALHGTGSDGTMLLQPSFAGQLFGAGQPLDADRYFIVIPDGIGHGKSSKPSDGLRAQFPKYGYRDMVEAQQRLVKDGLGVDRLRLVIGTSMGGMHTWLWGGRYPDFMDALMPLGSLPAQIAGRNRIWRRIIIDAIRNDPAWQNGDYTAQPPSLRTARSVVLLMAGSSVNRLRDMPTREKADRFYDANVARMLEGVDANDMLYSFEASANYDPAPDLAKIRAPLTAMNFADDLINPAELGILEREIKLVPNGLAVLIPQTAESDGHSSLTNAALWKSHVTALLARSAPAGSGR